MNIALVNCAELPEPDPDEQPLLEALRSAGHHAESAAWDDPDIQWASFDAAVLRATWNYHTQPAEFLEWCDRTSRQTRLLNAPDVIRWNSHKTYLTHFEERRIPIVPTLWGAKDASPSDDPIADAVARGWTKLVVKPSVSAGSRDTKVFDVAPNGSCDDATAFAGSLRAKEDIMVQRYMSSVATVGETSIITIAGEISHAIQKYPRFAGQDERVEPKHESAEEDKRFALAVLDACPFKTLFARVDIMRDDTGGIMLSELELIEPSLYFSGKPGSADRMVRAIESAFHEHAN